ncbi:MAG: HAD family phosphatase [Desulfatiglandaceae bacterium]
MKPLQFEALFLDIGGVLLTNGWDRHMRKAAAEKFGLQYEEMDERHHLTFDTYEEGKLSLDEYLLRLVFYEDRPFTPEEFKQFMFAQSQPISEMIDLIFQLRKNYSLKVAAVSNEGRELTIHRIEQFKLKSIFDMFVSSCFVHFRKPDKDIYRLALDCVQVPPEKVIYIDDRAMFVEVAKSMGIQGVHHTGYEPTRTALETLGLSLRH